MYYDEIVYLYYVFSNLLVYISSLLPLTQAISPGTLQVCAWATGHLICLKPFEKFNILHVFGGSMEQYCGPNVHLILKI